MEKATSNSLEQVLYEDMFSFILCKHLEVECWVIDGCMLKKKKLLQSSLKGLYISQQCMKVLVASYSCQHLRFSFL